jgi:uncharacterized protein (TIGR03083 family)
MGLNPNEANPNEANPNEANHRAAPRDPRYEDLALYALDSLDRDEALTIEALLATDPVAAAVEAELRGTAGEFAAADPQVDREPPTDLRERVLAAAFARRPAKPTGRSTGGAATGAAASVVEVHRRELHRFEALLGGLSPEQWSLPVDPPEFDGWTVHDLAVHVTANEANLAQLLGYDDPAITELDNSNDDRTRAAIDRHRRLTPADTIDELRRCTEAVEAALATRGEPGLDEHISWWGTNWATRTVLVFRSFETWTHGDDIRRAVGRNVPSPPEPILRTMGRAATDLIPVMVHIRGHHLPGRSVRIGLTGIGGDTFDVDLASGIHDPLTGPTIQPDAEITLDIMAFCRATADRFPSGPLIYDARGDLDLARDVVDSFNALAVL